MPLELLALLAGEGTVIFAANGGRVLEPDTMDAPLLAVASGIVFPAGIGDAPLGVATAGELPNIMGGVSGLSRPGKLGALGMLVINIPEDTRFFK